MGRLPFNSDRAKGADRPAAPQAGVLTVSQLAAIVGEAVESASPGRIAVAGEVSQPRESTHLYFTLKDASSGIQAVMFASTLRRASVRPEHGQQVIAHGKLSYFAPQGRVSLIVDRVEAVGRGALEQQLKELATELRALGWFDDDRKRPLPTLPRCVAVITSLSGAALQDVLDTSARRCSSVRMVVVGAKMQGSGSAEQVAVALRWCAQQQDQRSIDAVIITRGGGSLEDLWTFNDRTLAKAVLDCPIPVVAAIGHETDTTIIELVADVRAATPTQAAMRVTPDAEALHQQIGQSASRLRASVRRSLRDAAAWLRMVSERSVLAEPAALIAPNRDRLEQLRRDTARSMTASIQQRRSLIDRLAVQLDRHRPAALEATRRERLRSVSIALRRAHRAAIDRRRALLASHERELLAVGPRAVLSRGFTCTMHERGGLVRSASDVAVGDRVRTLTGDGGFDSTVRHTRSEPSLPKTARDKPTSEPDPPGLFDGG